MIRVPTGHVYRRSGPHADTWYAKYRLPDGRQVKRRIGPAWTSRGRPAAGYYTKRTAEGWMRDLLDEARRGTLPGMVRTGVTFADAAAEYMRWIEHDRARKPSTVRDYRSIIKAHLLPAFGDQRLEDITTEGVERWAAGLTVGGRMNNRTKLKILTVLHGVMKRAKRVWRLPRNPVTDVEKPVQTDRTDIDVSSPEDVMALVRAAASEQDAAIYLTAAFTGLRRGELIGLRWRDVDFAGSLVRVRRSYSYGGLTVPKSGRARAVPLAPEVARALARLGARPLWTGEDDLVFPGETGEFLDGSALRRRYYAAQELAGIKRLRFHDLRHTFGTRMIAVADIVRVKEWMGHADIETTMRYLHFAPRPEDAALVARAFRLEQGPAAGASSAFGDWSPELV
jgi:integrase